ncbi:MAG TPA: N-6 DNA methylase, partial [Chitinophagaceae bacterium]|nr:N-6 DNA methylase [Chitinophagaceae bacterium]
VANLLFSEPFYEGPVGKEALSIDSKKRELLYLKLILRKLEQSARAVLLVSDNMLKENGSLLENEIKSEIVDQCRLDAVVSLPPNSISNTSKNAAILVFSKEAVTTEHPVFFYHIHDDGVSGGTDKKKIRKLANAPLMFPDDYGDIPDLFNQWKVCKREYTCEPTSQSMLVPSAEIRERNYSLNIRSFLKQDDKKPASVVTQNRQAFPANRPASTRSTSMRWVPIAALFLLAIAAAFYFLRKDDKGSKVATNTFSGGDTAGSVNASEDTQRIKTPESTKKVKDTLIRISPAEVPPVQPPVATTSSPKQAEKRSEETTEKVSEEAAEKQPKTEATTTRTSIDANAAKGEYKIINKAYFHNEPDESTRRNAFVVHWNNSYATLKALDEKNGFIYVVFKNNLGQVSKGWLKKGDLRRINEEKQ